MNIKQTISDVKFPAESFKHGQKSLKCILTAFFPHFSFYHPVTGSKRTFCQKMKYTDHFQSISAQKADSRCQKQSNMSNFRVLKQFYQIIVQHKQCALIGWLMYHVVAKTEFWRSRYQPIKMTAPCNFFRISIVSFKLLTILYLIN